jgi:hypothetical protein
MSGNQSELSDPPKDGISAMQFAPGHNLLLVSSWSSEVRMYDVLMNSKKAHYSHKVRRLFDRKYETAQIEFTSMHTGGGSGLLLGI